MDKFIKKSQEVKKSKFQEFIEGFREYERKNEVERLRNEFLDAYADWLKEKTRSNKLKILRSALKLSTIDKEFKISNLFKK